MKKPRAPRLVTVAVFTTITIVFWVFLTLYSILTGKPDLKIEEKLLEPINPELDTKALDQIEARVFYDEGAVINPLVVVSPGASRTTVTEEEETPTPTPTTEIPEATDEATLE